MFWTVQVVGAFDPGKGQILCFCGGCMMGATYFILAFSQWFVL